MLEEAGCNAGRSLITLCLPYAASASEVAQGSCIDLSLQTNSLKEGETPRQTRSNAESRDTHFSGAHAEHKERREQCVLVCFSAEVYVGSKVILSVRTGCSEEVLSSELRRSLRPGWSPGQITALASLQ